MAIYHLSARVISRSAGRSAVAAAAYRSGARLHDARLDRDHDFRAKAGVVHREVLLPEGAPARLADRERLWNEVEAVERRRDAQLAREIELALPRELSDADNIALARGFVARELVARGMVADLNVHVGMAPDGQASPHAHVMLSLRAVGAGGFAAKVRDWNATAVLEGWRERWAEQVNLRLAEHGVQVDHRSYAAQGIGLEPQHKIGPAAARRDERGEVAERAAEHRDIARRNGQRILADPGTALDAITRQQATFTRADLGRLVHRQTDGAAQFAAVMARVEASPELVRLGRDGQGRERFSTRSMLATEARLERAAERLGEGRGHGVGEPALRRAEAAGGTVLGEEQRTALGHVLGRRDLALVVGYAGTGKSTLLGAAREAWEGAGQRVRGAALSGIAAEGLQAGSGIASRTIASLEHAWGQGRERLGGGDVLVVDEAGMVGSRQLERVLGQAAQAGAKVVLVGDPAQLQAIEAGAAFRALAERHGAVELTEVRRQGEGWQRAATRELATGRTAEALGRYEAAGMVHGHATRDAAKTALVERWAVQRRHDPAASQMILAPTRDDVRQLNELARAKLREAGELGAERTVTTERGPRAFAAGDRLMFLRNERGLGVRNGSLGTVEGIAGSALTVRLDVGGRPVDGRPVDGRSVGFDVKGYAHLDHGYAATVHKAQGVTVDRTHVLATGQMDRHSAYVALSRHRDRVELHWASEDLGDRGGLDRALGRERSKDSTLDYAHGFALRREITPAAGPDVAARRERLAAQVARARGAAAQLAAESKARRFAADWRQLEQKQEKLVRLGDRRERQLVTAKLAGMEARLGLDPALQATLCLRHRQLGVSEGLGRALRDPGRERTRERSRGFGLEL